MTLPFPERAPGRLAGWLRAGLAFGLTAIALVLFAGAFLLGLAVAFDGRALPGVSVAGVPLAGLDRPQAAARLRQALPSLAAGNLTLQLDGASHVVPYTAIGRDYDLGPMLDTAFAVGRSGTLLDRASDELRSLLRGTTVGAAARYDRAALAAAVATVDRTLGSAGHDAAVMLPAGATAFRVIPSAPGREVDSAASLAALDQRLAARDPASITVDLAVADRQPQITTAEAEAAATAVNGFAGRDLAVGAAGQVLTIPAATVRGWVTFGPTPDGTTLAPIFDQAKIMKALGPLALELDQVTHNAGFTFSGDKITGVTPAVEGHGLDLPGSAALIAQTLGSLAPAAPLSTLALPATVIKPPLSTAQAQAALPQMQLVSSWTTSYVSSDHNFFGANIQVPANQINGTVLAPGELFDFWKAVTLTVAAGFGPGGAIINGHTDPTGALGGGICSDSTTLFNAALRYGLEMGARANHYYYIDRYPLGLDATVFKSDGGGTQTMSFRNDTPNPIYIRGVNTFQHVTFQLWSVPDGRKVSLTTPIVKNKTIATDTVQYTSTIPVGTTKRIEYPADGQDTWVTRTVVDAAGKVIHQETYVSHYARITGLTLIGAPTP